MMQRIFVLLLALSLAGCTPAEDADTRIESGPAAFQTARQPYTFEGGVAQLFFTRPGIVRGGEEDPEVDDAIVEAIENAESTLDLCLYEFDRESIVEAVVEAANRGVRVRFAGDGDELLDDGYVALDNAGVDLILRKPRDRIMHNKFVVIDGQIVFTGSMNFSENGLLRNNNHAMRIESSDVAAAYTAEFEQMYVEQKFGTKKEPLGLTMPVGVGSIPAEVWFSPQDDIDEKVRAKLADADHSVYFMIFSFTHGGISDDLIALRDSGVDVVGVYDESQARGRYSSDEKLARAGVPVLIDGNENNIGFAGGKLHHKVMIIDGNTDSDPTVIIGSYNWSKSATRYNDENVMIFSGATAVAPFLEEFCDVLSVGVPHPDYAGKIPDPCSQLLTPVRINEFMPNPEGTDGPNEWVELVNTGTAPIDLTGWTLGDSVDEERHLFDGDILRPKDAIVIHSGTRQGVARNVASSGSLSLTNNTDRIVLRDNNGVLIDQVDYKGADSGVSFNRMPDGGAEGDFVQHDTLSALDSSPGSRVDGSDWEGAPRLIINEVMANPSGTESVEEYVEIYNPTVNPVNPMGWTLGDTTASDRHVFGDRLVQPGEVVVVWSGGTRTGNDVVASSGTLSLNNGGDQVTLRRNGRFMSSMSYGSTTDGTSLNREIDGDDSTSFLAHDAATGATSTSSPGTRVDGSLFAAAAEERVIMNELLPNPDGTDTGNEFVEIVNVGTQTLDLTGWVLSDGVAERHTFDAVTLQPGEFVVVWDSGSHNEAWSILASSGSLGLNNAGDALTLVDASGVERDAVSYTSSESGISLNRSPDGTPNAVLDDHDSVGTGLMSPGTRADGSAW